MADTTDDLPAHSPLGASSAERWMNCPGSIALLNKLDLTAVSDEPDYRREGIAMHEAAAHCLAAGTDTWEIVGEKFHDTEIDGPMADAVQVYLDRVRPSINGFHGQRFFIETRLARPEVHASMFGTVDFGAMVPSNMSVAAGACPPKSNTQIRPFLDVTDLKGGEGIVVDPEDNEQMKYYAFMLLDQHFADASDDLDVRLTIVQPRAFDVRGPIRDWWTTAGEIRAWVKDELVPAMLATQIDGDLDAGPWCRFCPAKLVCPLLTGLFKAACVTDPKTIVTMDDKTIGREYQQVQAVKFYLKALEEEALRRLQLGQEIDGIKLVPKKANRVFNEEVEVMIAGKKVAMKTAAALVQLFGDEALTKAEIKSPAQIAGIGPDAKKFVSEWAYTPQTGLTVALASDKQPAVKVAKPKEVFAAAAAVANGGT